MRAPQNNEADSLAQENWASGMEFSFSVVGGSDGQEDRLAVVGRLFRAIVGSGEAVWSIGLSQLRRRAPSPFWPPVWVLLLSLGLWALIWAAVSLFSAYALP
jgi:hypothetical protein